jgi:CheY-like chemotaxis protein
VKLLYIDDSTFELEFAAKALRDVGYEVHTRTGLTGLDDILPGTEIVLIDFHMPGIDGGEVLRLIRERAPEGDTPPACYLYTSDKEIGANYKELGFDGRIILKGNAEALVKQINAARRVLALRQVRPG